jgi:hypothetical protein
LNHFLSIKIPGKSPGFVMVIGFQFDHTTVLRITDNRFFVSLFEAGNRYAEQSDQIESLNSNETHLKIYVTTATFSFNNSMRSSSVSLTSMSNNVVTKNNVIAAFICASGGALACTLVSEKAELMAVNVHGSGAITASFTNTPVILFYR